MHVCIFVLFIYLFVYSFMFTHLISDEASQIKIVACYEPDVANMHTLIKLTNCFCCVQVRSCDVNRDNVYMLYKFGIR